MKKEGRRERARKEKESGVKGGRKAEEKEHCEFEKENCPARNRKKHQRESRDGLQRAITNVPHVLDSMRMT